MLGSACSHLWRDDEPHLGQFRVRIALFPPLYTPRVMVTMRISDSRPATYRPGVLVNISQNRPTAESGSQAAVDLELWKCRPVGVGRWWGKVQGYKIDLREHPACTGSCIDGPHQNISQVGLAKESVFAMVLIRLPVSSDVRGLNRSSEHWSSIRRTRESCGLSTDAE